MTQLCSNLVTYENNTTYLCLVLAFLCSPVILRVRLASLHTTSLLPHSSSHHSISSLASVPPFIDHSRQRKTNTLFKTKSLFA